jgi:sortase A
LKTIYNSDVKYREKLSLDRLNQPFIEELQPNSNAAQTFKAENIVNIKDIQYPKLGEHYAMLTCERIQLDVPVYWGDTTKILNAGVGQFMGSFLPGFDRSILLSAHNTTYFKPIERIKVGDIVIYDTNYGEFQYIVDEVSIINVEEAEDMLNHLLALHEEKLIMYTCYPFQSLAGNKEKRMFAFADKLTGPRVVK